MKVTVRTPCKPTEVEARVVEAATAWFDGDARRDGDMVVVETDSLDALRERIWEQRIIDTVRSAIVVDGPTLRFRLGKQAALAGKVAIPPARHALGDLDVTVRTEDEAAAEALLWWLCPETQDGQIVGGQAGAG